MGHVSDIKLIRTDTTLDLSQKAEKGMSLLSKPNTALLLASSHPVVSSSDGGPWIKNSDQENGGWQQVESRSGG
ncbi:hypothetical protein CKAN_01466800 [Cinnamomum micranthum f. kanehirae]|uniref:Uncharacterized protein n=1 Tax=Cinnamomum micranthum f. kanehirae TaxID=337451 RepID=A0A443P4V1_9MAGN|nr:hypothetical protein CKAN_01466800 [Cinnamomum micranthum f. kanehirae]